LRKGNADCSVRGGAKRNKEVAKKKSDLKIKLCGTGGGGSCVGVETKDGQM